MRFALFYEIPVPRPWGPDSERLAYEHTIEQAVAGDRFGWDAFWTVEHHFLEEYSHCSNPEVLYGAIAAQTERIRLGYGVRLMPKPYNHPVRTAESVAVLDLISNGRVDLGTGRSSTRAELEGFGIDPAVGDEVEHGHRLGGAHRVVVGLRHQADTEAEAHPLRLRGDGAVEHLGVRAVRVLLEEVVLHRPERIPAVAFTGQRLLDRVLVREALGVGTPRSGDGDLVEQGEAHGARCTGHERSEDQWVESRARS